MNARKDNKCNKHLRKRGRSLCGADKLRAGGPRGSRVTSRVAENPRQREHERINISQVQGRERKSQCGWSTGVSMRESEPAGGDG